jgi:hypothetical protein
VKIIRVFPRRTKATPDDVLTYVGSPDMFAEADEVHISVTFTYDIKYAEILERQWRCVAPVVVGGPALNDRGGEFEPGMYLKNGYVITSRGCPNNCWFCSVPRREGNIRELNIKDGWNVLDSNLLACSDDHIKSVFEMLSRQNKKAEFTGGLEANRLKQWHADKLYLLKPRQIFFAYDTPDDFDPLVEAGKMLNSSGIKSHPHSHVLRCYVLCGYPGDTIANAERRMRDAMVAGFTPMAMVYRDKKGLRSEQWAAFQRKFARPAIIYSKN